ncbi:hypothetical protein BDR06DRAFT_1012515 [Suillus hirtellus]|nr:hypothetical protein BDR06DRAFT_1012515 [Suillus hirtellus]
MSKFPVMGAYLAFPPDTFDTFLTFLTLPLESSPNVSPPSKLISLGLQTSILIDVECGFLTTPLCTLDFWYYSLLLHGIDQHITTDVDAWAEGVAGIFITLPKQN